MVETTIVYHTIASRNGRCIEGRSMGWRGQPAWRSCKPEAEQKRFIDIDVYCC